MIRKPNNDHIPAEAVLKWLKKDRDYYRDKLEELIEYTKLLEKKVKEQDKLLALQDQRIKLLKAK